MHSCCVLAPGGGRVTGVTGAPLAPCHGFMGWMMQGARTRRRRNSHAQSLARTTLSESLHGNQVGMQLSLHIPYAASLDAFRRFGREGFAPPLSAIARTWDTIWTSGTLRMRDTRNATCDARVKLPLGLHLSPGIATERLQYACLR